MWEPNQQTCDWQECAQNTVITKPTGKIPPGRPRHRWKANIKTDLAECVLKGTGLI